MLKKTALPDDVRLFIVERLACFDAPKAVAEAVKAEFGLDVSRQAIEAALSGRTPPQ